LKEKARGTEKEGGGQISPSSGTDIRAIKEDSTKTHIRQAAHLPGRREVVIEHKFKPRWI